MKKALLATISLVFLATSVVAIAPASAGSYCNNGSYSSNSGRGTCSYNGGVNKSFPSYSDPGSSSFNRNNGFGNSTRMGSTRSNGFGNSSGLGSSRSRGLGSTSSWGNSLGSSSCTMWSC